MAGRHADAVRLPAVPRRDRVEVDLRTCGDRPVQLGHRQRFMPDAERAAGEPGSPARLDDGVPQGGRLDPVELVQLGFSRVSQ